jgi:hypothetical protein
MVNLIALQISRGEVPDEVSEEEERGDPQKADGYLNLEDDLADSWRIINEILIQKSRIARCWCR